MAQRIRPIFLIILLLSLSLSACGIRPKTLSPPEGAENKKFPAIYPNPSTLNLPPEAPKAPEANTPPPAAMTPPVTTE